MALGGAALREWDMRVVFLHSRQCWWWSAWHAPTNTELYGFAATQEEARAAMYAAIVEAQ
ncbi:hypothetical protein BJF78_30735 [Pseudonocardia sp. CNS-139]|nr:hypothetical protein BJF78_30735 [Pseudonocardia sp. CNS-139]